MPHLIEYIRDWGKVYVGKNLGAIPVLEIGIFPLDMFFLSPDLSDFVLLPRIRFFTII